MTSCENQQLLLSICDTLHTSNVTQPSQVFTYVRQSRIRLGNNTHYILSLKLSRVVVLYCISSALHNKKKIEYRKQLGFCYSSSNFILSVRPSQCCTTKPIHNLRSKKLKCHGLSIILETHIFKANFVKLFGCWSSPESRL